SEEHTSELQSSRRRHTRSLRDWSSDVCSSDRKSTRLNSSHVEISYDVFCLKKNRDTTITQPGFIRDRCNLRASGAAVLGSNAATGLGIPALYIGLKRGFVFLMMARPRVFPLFPYLWLFR